MSSFIIISSKLFDSTLIVMFNAQFSIIIMKWTFLINHLKGIGIVIPTISNEIIKILELY